MSTVLRQLLVASALLLLAAPVAGQGFPGFGRRSRRDLGALRGLPDVREGFMFCRLWFEEVRRDPSGTGWRIEYPRADRNFMIRLSQLTSTRMSRWDDGSPGHTVVRATDPELFSCPFVMIASPGTAGLSDADIQSLRTYVLKGGFLWGDDFWGDDSRAHFERIVQEMLPEYPITEITPEHPLFDSFYLVKELPQIPSLNRWRPGRCTCERPGAEYATPHMRGVFDKEGRLLILLTHNTDIADGWEREQDMEAFFVAFAWKAYSIGVNVAIWTMTH